MDREAILEEIKTSLNGDELHDVDILVSKIVEYSEDSELVSEISAIALDYLSDEALENLQESITRSNKVVHEAYEKAFHLAEVGLYEEALETIDEYVQEIMPLEYCVKSTTFEMRSFSEQFERDMYIELEKPDLPVQDSPLPCADIFILHGSILMGLGRYSEAITSLSLALVWNPVSHDAAVMLSEAYKFEDNDEMLYSLTMNSFKFAYRKVYLAELYYNLGYHFAMNEQWTDAMACLTLSSRYGGKEIAQSAIYQIEHHVGRKMAEPSMEDIERSAAAQGYQIGPDRRLQQLAREMGQEAYADGEFDEAKYYYTIAYDLFADDEDGVILESLNNETILM